MLRAAHLVISCYDTTCGRRFVTCCSLKYTPQYQRLVILPLNPGESEFFHPRCSLDRLLPTSPPRMTRGADGDAERRHRRACGIQRATRARNDGLTIRGMSSRLHGLLLWHGYGAGCLR